MKRLQISSVAELSFGVHRNRSIHDLAHDFLCILGPNESGKSTLAEFLQWSIGGPGATSGSGGVGGVAAQAERFLLADGGRELTGRLEGRLDTDPFEVSGRFKVLQKGAPNDRRTALLAGVELDAVGIAGALGGVNPTDYAQIHRVRGAELVGMTETDGFSSMFTQFAVGSAAASINPRARLAELQSALRSAEQRVKALNRDVKELRARISTAARRPVEVDAIEAQMDAMTTLLDELGVTQGELLRQRALIDRARSILPARSASSNAAAELDELGPISEPWREVIRLAGAVSEAHAAVESARAHVSETERELTEARGLLGLAPAALIGVELTLADRDGLQDAAKQVREAEDTFARAIAAGEELARSIDERDRDLTSTAAALGVEPITGAGLVGREVSLRDLLPDAAIWVEAEAGATQAESVAVSRRAAFELLRANPATVTAPAARRFAPRVIVLIIGMLAAVLAALVHPLVAVPVALIAILIAVLLPESVGAGAPVVDDALETARRDAADATRMAEEARSRADLRGGDLRRAIEELGAPPVTEPALVRSHLQQLADLAAMATTLHSDRARLTEHTASLTDLDARCLDARARFGQLLTQRGITSTPPLDRFDEWLTQYAHALSSARSVVEASERLSRASADRDALIEPVAQELADSSWPQRLARLAEMSDRLATIEAIEKRHYEAGLVLAAIGDDQPIIDALLQDHPDEFSLRARHEELTAAIEQLEQDRTQRIIDFRDLEVAHQGLLATEVLSSLHEEQKSLDEELEEAMRAKDVLGHSVAVLNEVIDRFESENQAPAVKRTRTMLQQVVPDWGDLILTRESDGKAVLERRSGSDRVVDSKLSDGARSLLYLALRLAFAIDDAERRGVALPILCDDPLVHLDDTRRPRAIELLAGAAGTHQVVLFTCDTATASLAQHHGAHVISI